MTDTTNDPQVAVDTAPPLANGQTEVIKAPPLQARLVSEDHSEVSHLMDTARFEQAQRVSQTLALSAFLPKHLKGNNPKEGVANCFRVVNQALRWGMDPFAVADETYVVSGRLGYQGKLVAAVVNSRAGLKGRLSATYTGEGMGRTVTISGLFNSEATPRTIDLSIAQAKTSNDMWTKDPDQKLYYSGVVKWARRHCPEVVLGVLTEDDVDKIAEARTIPSGTIRFTQVQMEKGRTEIEHGQVTVEEIVQQFPGLAVDQVEILKGYVFNSAS